MVVEPEEVLTACRRLAEAMDGFDAAAAQELGVNRTDLRAMNLLEEGAVGQVAIAAALGITRASVTVLVDRLEKAGYVRRLPDPNDRRVTLVELLPAMWGAFARVYRPAGDRVLAVADGWSGPERRIVAEALDALARAFANRP